MKTDVVQIGGMTCAACVSRVERAIAKVPGVHDVAVDLATHRARVSWIAEAKQEALHAAVRSAGYAIAERHEADPDAAIDAALRRDLRHAASLAVPLFVLGMSHERLVPSLWSSLIQAVLAAAILVGPGRGYFARAFHALRAATFDMNSLVALGALTSFFYSMVAVAIQGRHAAHGLGIYFETSGIIVTFALLGRVLETGARKHLGSAVTSLLELRPAMSHRVTDSSEEDVATSSLAVGDVVRVRPGERVPADGAVLAGTSQVDESMITGEARLVDKAEASRVLAGTVNGSGALTIRVESPAGAAEIDRIAEALEATSRSAPVSRLVDRFSRVFVPLILVLAVMTFAVWLAMNPHLAGLPMAMQRFVSVLVIACPCALGLATPAAIRVALARAAELGMQVRGGAVLEAASRVDYVLFDKTGTLTNGTPVVTEVLPVSGADPLAAAAAVERSSEHPLGRAIVAAAQGRGLTLDEASEFGSEAGGGAFATVSGTLVRVGSAEWLQRHGVHLSALESRGQKYASNGANVVFVSANSDLLGALVLQDEPREAAFALLRELREGGLSVAMVTGDRAETAAHVAKRLRIDEVHAAQKPHDKLTRVKDLQAKGHVVAMVGDGVNDGPALASADVAIAMGTGTGAALHVSDVALVGTSVASVPQLFELARATMRTIRRNLAFAFVYNLCGIPLAAGVFSPFLHVELSPMFASAAMSLSSVSVLASSLWLRRFQPRKAVSMKTYDLLVRGMTCGNCVRHVEKALRGVPGVADVAVDLASGAVKVSSDDAVLPLDLTRAVEGAGYEVATGTA